MATLLGFAATMASAEAQTWNGTTDSTWSTGTNWSGGVAPAPGAAVVVAGAGGSNQPVLDVNASVSTVALSGGSLSLSNRELDATTSVTVTGGELNLQTGRLITPDTGTLNVNGGTVNLGKNDNIADQTVLSVNGGTFDVKNFNEAVNTVTLKSGQIAGSAGGTLLSINAHYAVEAGTVSAVLVGMAGLNKTTGGTVTLSGAMTYQGRTDVSAGTLLVTGSILSDDIRIRSTGTLEVSGSSNTLADNAEVEISGTGKLKLGKSETIGSLSGNGDTTVEIAGNTLTVGDIENTTYAGVISGTGNLVKQGSGTLTLSGSNAYSGTTTVNNGALALANVANRNALDDATQVTLNNRGALLLGTSETIGSLASASVDSSVLLETSTLTTGNATNTTFAGIISGSGTSGLTKAGSGVFTLTNVNTYTGLTTVNGGTLNVTGSIASASIVVNNTGSLQVDGAALADTAQVALNGTGNLKLDGSETIGSLTGATGATVTLGANTLTTGDAANTTFAGKISGTGGLTKQGGGIFTLSGENDYSGLTSVNAGTLSVTGKISGPVNVLSGGTLGGTGAVGALSVASGGVLSPGMSIGTLTVNGNLTLAAGSSTVIEVDTVTPEVDLIKVTGAASLGGTLNVNDVSAFRSTEVAGVYTILEAASVSGTFATVTHDFLFVTPGVDYLSDRVNLVFERNETPLAGLPGSTVNQNAVGGAIDSTAVNLGQGSAAYQTLVNQLLLSTDPAKVLASLDQLSGAEYAQHVQSVLWSTRAINRIVTERMECGASSRDYARADGTAANLMAKDAPISATGCFTPGEVALWMRGFGSWNTLDGDNNAPGFDETQYGILFGADYSFNGSWFMGLSGGYFDSAGSFDGFGGRSGGSIDYDGLQLAAYGGFDNSVLYVRGIAAYGNYSGDSSRGISGPGAVAGRLTGDPSSDVLSFYGETGYRLAAGGLGNVTPFVGLGVAAATLDGFTEKDKDGTGAALSFDGNDVSSTTSMLGLRFDSLLDMGSGIFSPELSVAWAHEFGDTYQSLDASFAEGPPGTDFTVIGSEVARDALVIGADINMALTAGLDLRLSYDGWFNGDYTSNAVTAKLGWSF